MVPTLSKASIFNFIIIGEKHPNSIEGIKNNKIAETIAPIFMLEIMVEVPIRINSDKKGISKTTIPETFKINFKLFFEQSLSAIFPPIKFPILVLSKIIPIMLVHTKLLLPK